MTRLRGRLAELAPQPRQVHVDRPVGTAVGLLPHLRQQLALGHDLPATRGEQGEHVELLARELQHPIVQGRRPGALVDHQPTHPRDRGRQVPPAPAQDGADARCHVVGAEGLDDVVVGAAVQSTHHRGVVVLGGDDDQRDVGRRADHRDQGQPVHVRQPQVEQDHLWVLLQDVLESGQPGADHGHGVSTLAQTPSDRRADRVVVLHHEDAGHARTVDPSGAGRAGRMVP